LIVLDCAVPAAADENNFSVVHPAPGRMRPTFSSFASAIAILKSRFWLFGPALQGQVLAVERSPACDAAVLQVGGSWATTHPISKSGTSMSASGVRLARQGDNW
jgi:hypothetical protein